MNEIDTSSLTKNEKLEIKQADNKKTRERMIMAKKTKKALPWAVLAVIVVGGIYWLSTGEEKTVETTTRLGEEIPIVSRDHINIGEDYGSYNSNPPTSGAHAGAAPWGFSEVELIDQNAIHNLEHGGIWITYKDIDEQSLETLRKIARSNPQSVLISPRAANDSPIAIASWGRLLKTDVVDEAQIKEFIKSNINQSPERLAR